MFENSLCSEEAFVPCQCDIFISLNLRSLANYSTAHANSSIQINKQPENLYVVDYRAYFSYFPQLKETFLF